MTLDASIYFGYENSFLFCKVCEKEKKALLTKALEFFCHSKIKIHCTSEHAEV